jgi:hypothetical protein
MNHYTKDIELFHQEVEKTKKIIVSIGCSFTYGHAAFSNDLMEEFPLWYKNGANWTCEKYDSTIKNVMINRWPNLKLDAVGNLIFSTMFLDNSFLTKLHTKYLKGTYTPLNLAVTSAGLHATVMRLLVSPILWEKADEIILIFCPTAPSRLCLINDSGYEYGNEFRTAWPTNTPFENQFFNKIQEGFQRSIYSPKWEVINFLHSWKILKTWMKNYNVKLITFPAFTRNYTPDDFKKILSTNIERSRTDGVITNVTDTFMSTQGEYLLNEVDWNTFIAPQGKNNFFDLAYSQEKDYNSNYSVLDLTGEHKGSSTKWITNCGHPSSKAHELLADELYKHLVETDFCKKSWNIWQ